jgi:hypothetical protein
MIMIMYAFILSGIHKATGLMIKSNEVIDLLSFRDYIAVRLECQRGIIMLMLRCLLQYLHVIENRANTKEDWKKKTK